MLCQQQVVDSAQDEVAAENGEGDSQDVAEAAHKLQDTLDHNTDAANSEQESSERRARVKDLFYAMDKDGNGKLDVGEFRGHCYCKPLPAINFRSIFQDATCCMLLTWL